MKNYACMYLRLSREDGDSFESNSIHNQREIIKTFAKDHDLEIIAEYADDGYSGSNFDRPQFKKMIEDLKQNKFQTIIVKDLSRFGRDYIESGKYLQKIFPELGTRFISVNDNYDSDSADVSDTHLILPIRNFINDSYCRDISMKVKSAKAIKRKNGEFIGSFACFGYKKDVKDKHKLVVDESVRHIIERIFQMKIEGHSSKGIADFLNSIGEVTPAKHKERKEENFNCGFLSKKAKWDAKMINRIIENKVYIGTLEQGKTTKLNYKSKKEIEVNETDWIRHEKSHPAIVSESTFNLANKMVLRDVKQGKTEPFLLSGMVYCKDCHSPMIRRKVKSKDGYKVFYICSKHNLDGSCTRHSIKEDEIINACQSAITDYVKRYESLIDKLKKLDIKELSIHVNFDDLINEKKRYETLRQSLYSDLEEELITTEEFERFRATYLGKIKEIEKQIKTKEAIVKELKENLNKDSHFLSEMIPEDTDTLTRMSLVSFIDQIEIGEEKEIHVVFNNVETMTLLETLVEEEKKAQDKEESNQPMIFSINKLIAANNSQRQIVALGGVS